MPQETFNDEKQTARRLRARAPQPGRDYSARLQERLSDLETAAHRPANLWPLVLVYLVCGLVLLVLAIVGAVGSGPIG